MTGLYRCGCDLVYTMNGRVFPQVYPACDAHHEPAYLFEAYDPEERFRTYSSQIWDIVIGESRLLSYFKFINLPRRERIQKHLADIGRLAQ